MTNLKNIEINSENDKKHFIIAKMWLNSKDGSRPGSIKVSRFLPANLVLKANTTLFIQPNNKRAEKQDADYSVSVLLPAKTSDALILAEKKLAQEAKNAAGINPTIPVK